MTPETKSKLKFVPTEGDLVDRLVIASLKELKIKEHRDRYTEEINDIIHDLDLLLDEKKVYITGKLIRDIILIAVFNDEIWINESNFRNAVDGHHNLAFTHGCNSLRTIARAKIQDGIDKTVRKEYKADAVMPPKDFVPSGY